MSVERVLILYHPRVVESPHFAEQVAEFLATHVQVQISNLQALTDSPSHYDAMVVLGGDGSMLRAGRLSAMHGTPVLGINFGRLGFLPEVQPDDWQAALERMLRGEYWLEARCTLQVTHLRRGEEQAHYLALNEAVIGRGAMARPVHLKTTLDGGELTTYVADGLIIATPTGSTAYAMAAGGPILPPNLRNMLLMPIAPHLSLDRAIVLPPETVVDVTVRTNHQAILSADGQDETPVDDGDIVRVTMSQAVAQFMRLRPPTYFYTSLLARITQNPAVEK